MASSLWKKIGVMQGIRGFSALEFWLTSWKPPYGFSFFFFLQSALFFVSFT
jgi:hypothetical protein